MASPRLGDVDGDGFDDFFVQVSSSGGPTPYESSNLFYGRPKFPEELSIDDSDALFEGNLYGVRPLGDINGDELADFAFRNSAIGGGFEIVLGSRERFSGRYASGSFSWQLPDPGTSILQELSSAGDVNCDGIDDLIVPADRVAEAEDGSFAGRVQVTYLVLGSAQVPSGAFDPAWATANFSNGPETGFQGYLHASAAGDLDGDGCGDLAMAADYTSFVFYGDRAKLQGWIDTRDADAELASGEVVTLEDGTEIATGNWIQPMLADLDGDGASDLFVPLGGDANMIQVAYGSKKRWSGRVRLEPEFTITMGPALSPLHLAVGDIDTIAGPELVISSADTNGGETLSVRTALYAVRGIGERRLGVYELKDADRITGQPELTSGATSSDEVELAIDFNVAGDVDGDDGSDIIVGAIHFGPAGPTGGGDSEVYLIPSTPRPPE